MKMIENLIKAATCVVTCGEESGTGFLVSEKLVLTAIHCVSEAVKEGEPIELKFIIGESEIKLAASILAKDDKSDVCVLLLSNQVEIRPIAVSANVPREGESWISFGHPVSRLGIVHRHFGVISQIFDNPKLKIDLDLSIDPSTSIDVNLGFSGAAVLANGKCFGMMRLKLDGSIGAISFRSLTDFFTENGIKIEFDEQATSEVVASDIYAERKEFQETLEDAILRHQGEYLFLEGAHGIGKTTFCKTFKPENESIYVLGCYCINTERRGHDAAYQAQPEIFHDWLSAQISLLLSGKPGRKEDKSYSQLILDVVQLFSNLSEFIESSKKTAVLFVDGLNEALMVGSDALPRLVNILPRKLPHNITVIFTSPNYNIVKNHISARVRENHRFYLPLLSDLAVHYYCTKKISSERISHELICHICEKAKGHPLYLRYLIEYANSHASDDELISFPVYAGAIEIYYEQLWAGLLVDKEAIHLLGIISRLRWGVSTTELTKILSEEESNFLIPTLSRITHLLLSPDNTTIYHTSFSDFLKSKTANIDRYIHNRLIDFCMSENETQYGAMNAIYHGLRGEIEQNHRAISLCDQEWVDKCVTLSVDPDTLIFDIEDVLSMATKISVSVEVIRILLLLQRINFRYNTLFAQSAQLSAWALISLGRPQEALQHTIRHGTLIVLPEEALQISYLLIINKYFTEASALLSALYGKLVTYLSNTDMTIEDYILLNAYLIRCLLFKSMADDDSKMNVISKILTNTIEVIRNSLRESSQTELLFITARLSCIPSSHFLLFEGRYGSLQELKNRFGSIPDNISIYLNGMLRQCLEWQQSFDVQISPSVLPAIFDDIDKVVKISDAQNAEEIFITIQTLIRLGAPLATLQKILGTIEHPMPQKFKLKNSNGVDFDHQNYYRVTENWMAVSFLNDRLECPLLPIIQDTNWLEALQELACLVSWCEGKARRAKSEGDAEALAEINSLVNSEVLLGLRFTLAERISWDRSYSIPEKLVPLIYKNLTDLYLDCFKDDVASLLQHLSDQSKYQCGLYSEGFKEIVHQTLTSINLHSADALVSDMAFDLIQSFKNFLLSNVENRYELVPDLFRLIPNYVKLNASEEAEKTYQSALNVSMGPSWYKEDQLGLIVSMLRSFPLANNDELPYAKIANYLEKASGEMTFQRYVRYDKANLIQEMFLRGGYVQGCSYFKRQVCGSRVDLLAEAQRGDLDRSGPLTGMRYPGGALDEQAVILKIVNNSVEASWDVKWSLLEIYQYGDERHLADFARAYAGLINTFASDTTALNQMISRMKVIVTGELNADQKASFLEAFKIKLSGGHHPHFSDLLSSYSEQSANGLCRKNIVHKIPDTEAPGELDEADEDKLFLPGTFGRKSATRIADQLVNEAMTDLKRGSKIAASEKAVKALKALQDGDWPIFGNMSSNADDILLKCADNADALVRFYGQLIIEENFSEKWRIAEKIIDLSKEFFNEEQRELLSQYIFHHVEMMIGKITPESFNLGIPTEFGQSDISMELLELIYWLLDHPQSPRRHKAADIISWLVENNEIYLRAMVKHAFSMEVNFGADIVCGVLDSISVQNPLAIWTQIEYLIKTEGLSYSCKNISRLTVLYRIAEKALHLDYVGAEKTMKEIASQFSAEKIKTNLAEKVEFPKWCDCIEHELNSLKKIGVIDNVVIAILESKMKEICAPLDIELAWNLEKLVSKGFRNEEDLPLSRWEANVRFALNVILFDRVSFDDFLAVEKILRVFNPSSLWLTRTSDFISPSQRIENATQEQIVSRILIGDDKYFYLNYQEVIQGDDGRSGYMLEVTATLASQFDGYRPNAPSDKSQFNSKEFFVERNGAPGYETCWRVSPEFAFLGTFTPGYPNAQFKKLIKANEKDFLRINWSVGRDPRYINIGHPMKEGCLLALKKDALILPDGWRIYWFVYKNQQLVSIINRNGKTLNG